MTSELKPTPLTFLYRNWRGEVSVRRVMPIRVWFGSTEWHPDLQWFLNADDLDKSETRDFAMADISRTISPEELERASKASFEHQFPGNRYGWNGQTDSGREQYREMMITALRAIGIEVADKYGKRGDHDGV